MQEVQTPLMKNIIAEILKNNLAADTFAWLTEKALVLSSEANASQLNLTFTTIPRKTLRHPLNLTEAEVQTLQQAPVPLYIRNWTIDRLSRAWLLLHLDSTDQHTYCKKLQNLFNAAEMNELAALYATMPLFAHPEHWQHQCTEGIRSNIGIVLEAVIYHNVYPCRYFNNAAWNQLVLKAFFTDKDVTSIIGLDERANPELAMILIDYAHERWSAHRTVNPQLWRLVAKYIDDNNIHLMQKLLGSSHETDRSAAALACFTSNHAPARELLNNHPELLGAINTGQLTWNNFPTT